MTERFMREAIRLAREGMRAGLGGPFGAVVVKDGEIIGRGQNRVISGNDPTAHAEIEAIRAACGRLGDFNLAGCELYASCEPCPMCLGAVYWARLDAVYFAADREDAHAAGFDDDFFYDEMSKSWGERRVRSGQCLQEEAVEVLREWRRMEGKVSY